MKLRRLSVLIVIAALIICALLLFGSWKWGWGRGEGTAKEQEKGGGAVAGEPAVKKPEKCEIRVDQKGIWVEETPRRLVDTTGAISYCKLRGGDVKLTIIGDAPHGVATRVEQEFARSGLPVEVVRPGR